MGMFDVQFDKEIQLKKNKKDFFEFLNKKLSEDENNQHSIEKNRLSINKNQISTALKYNLKVEFFSPRLFVEAELDNSYTIFITILILLSILFTYGIGIILVIGFVYYQKVKATKHLKSLIDSYSTLE